MKNKIIALLILFAPFLASSPDLNAQEKKSAQAPKFHKKFVEHFNTPVSEYFISYERDLSKRRYIQTTASFCEKDTEVMMLRIDTMGNAGPGGGPNICSKEQTFYGSYSARIRIPDVKKVQPNVGAVVGYFTYGMDAKKGSTEIDMEWLIADPEIIYIGTWTGPANKLQRVGRIINLAKGVIYESIYRYGFNSAENKNLTGLQNQPETIPAIEGFNAAKQFYTYGFDWYPDRIVWWILHPETEQRIVLWDYQGSTPLFKGIPNHPARYMLNFWHTNNWPVHTNEKSIEVPKYAYEVEVDWMAYEPFDIE